MLLPVLVLGGLFGHYATGLVATFGAQCLAIIDQPGGPQRHRTNEMLGGALLGTLTVIITGLASTHPVLIWLAVIAQCFVFSMFTVFGKRGGLIGFAALLLMTLTMHSPLEPDQVLAHAAATLGGALFYVAFSLGFAPVLAARGTAGHVGGAVRHRRLRGRARRLLRRDRGPGRRLSRADPEPVHHDGKTPGGARHGAARPCRAARAWATASA